jgi:hypothetical protein
MKVLHGVLATGFLVGRAAVELVAEEPARILS